MSVSVDIGDDMLAAGCKAACDTWPKVPDGCAALCMGAGGHTPRGLRLPGSHSRQAGARHPRGSTEGRIRVRRKRLPDHTCLICGQHMTQVGKPTRFVGALWRCVPCGVNEWSNYEDMGQPRDACGRVIPLLTEERD
jgi:hypothetical protein